MLENASLWQSMRGMKKKINRSNIFSEKNINYPTTLSQNFLKTSQLIKDPIKFVSLCPIIFYFLCVLDFFWEVLFNFLNIRK